jgi:hypothetical protein
LKTTIYIEGGGDTKSLHSQLRQGFQALFKNAGFTNRLPKVVACGSRNDTFKDFQIALKKKKENEQVLLLVDSEDIITKHSTKWNFVKKRDGWDKPEQANEENIFFMVVCMESWFLADVDGVNKFFGKDFDLSKLPKKSNLEKIDKTKLYRGLKQATKKTAKGEYGKGQHSFKILTYLNAIKVSEHGTYSKQFFDYLTKIL